MMMMASIGGDDGDNEDAPSRVQTSPLILTGANTDK